MINVTQNLASIFEPKPKPIASEWVEENILLTSPLDTIKGKAQLDKTPWVKYIINRMQDPKWRDCSLQLSTQTSKTFCTRVLGAFLLDQDPASFLFAFPNQALAKSWSETRWLPLFDSPVLTKYKPQSKHDFSKLRQNLNNGALCEFVGGGSAASLMSRSAKYLIVDEVNAFYSFKQKYDPIKLLKERTKSHTNTGFLRIWASTPTDSDGAITKNLEEGTNTRMFVYSAHAKDKPPFELKTKMLKCAPEAKLPDGSYNWRVVLETCYLECPYTQKPIYDYHKPGMINGAEYIDTNLNHDPHHFSFQLSALYSPFLKWGDILVAFLQARGDINALMAFTQNMEGEAFDIYSFSDESKSLKEQKVTDNYKLGEQVGAINLMFIDRQAASFKWVVRSYSGKKSWLVAYGECQTYAELDQLQRKYNPLWVGLDSGQGERTSEVLEAVEKRKSVGWVATKGAQKLESGLPFNTQKVNAYIGTNRQGLGRKVTLITFNNELLKREINFCRNGGNSQWKVPEDVGEDYEAELFAEYPKKRRNKSGQQIVEWYKPSNKKNDYWDCECGLYALSLYGNVSEMESYAPRALPDAPPEEKVIEEVKIVEQVEQSKGWTADFLKSKAMKF